MTISVLSIGGTDYNSYASNTEADEYLAADFVRASAWAAFTEDQQNQLLVTATRRLDRLRWQGTKTAAAQPLEFPRDGLTDKDGNSLADNTLPDEIVSAAILLAYAISQDTSVESAASTGSNVKRVKAGSVEIENFRATVGTRFITEVQELVGTFLQGPLNALSVFGGTDIETAFGTDWGRSEGYP